VKRAKVFSKDKLIPLVAFLTQRISETEGMERCVIAMDRTAVLYLWETLACEKECGQVRQDQIDAAEGTVYPGWTKTVRQEPSARIGLAVAGGQERLTFLESASHRSAFWLKTASILARREPYLFRAQNRSRNGFDNKPITSSVLRKRVQKRLHEAGLFEGETLRSFRRSAVQHAAI
jgi:integrase